jgi:NTP pyrophosphatase (non-canonical NTP hydrolase)
MLLNLVGEVGELASKIAKNIRKENVYIGGQKELKGLSRLCFYPHFFDKIEEWDEELMKEAGDILWQLAGLCRVMGWNLDDIAQMNLKKLASRQRRGVIDGEGDNR